MMLPGELRLRGLRNRIRILPCTSRCLGPEIFCALPAHKQLMGSLAECDWSASKTESDLRALRDYAQYEAGGRRCGRTARSKMFGRRLRAGRLPIGIDVEEMKALAAEAESDEEVRRLADSVSSRQLIIGVDRLDYSKGILNRIDAVGELLTSRPDYRKPHHLRADRRTLADRCRPLQESSGARSKARRAASTASMPRSTGCRSAI
jgi:trehalose 6-phosphate synthase